ncbi:MAG TPA: CCA tRNA nucleotidyltransferase [Candidatus Limnocylindria bacterium]|jgi:poly(A) polymerase/tRNA nucleotidyltransferase (CCA-adding enzyme)
MRDGDPLRIDLPPAVASVLDALRQGGAESALVGGSVRDLVRGDQPGDWDVATSAPPESVAARFPGATWENPFGTVTVRDPAGGRGIEVTTYRVEGGYRDRRRPDEVRWGQSLADDLARRDFTINAMAWLPDAAADGSGRLVDPHGGAADLEAGLLRAVGDPDERFDEDALRLLRAVRLANRFQLRVDPPTEAAILANAPNAAGLSGERVRDELMRILAGAAPPSRAFELMERLGLLDVLLAELAALRGVPQTKRLAGDALDHSLRTADALPAVDPVLRLAGLLHDLGKATTLADGHFLHHDRDGAVLAEQVLQRLRAPRAEVTRVGRLVRHHMFAYTPDWTDAAVRRFVRRVGVDLLPDLFALREADDVASGVDEPPGGWKELRDRVASVANDPLEARQLAISGDDLVTQLGIAPGPAIGRMLAALLDAVVEDPTLNSREQLLTLARAMASG